MRIRDGSSDVCASELARQRIDRILALEFRKQFLLRLAKYVEQQIEAATMRHAEDDLIDVTRRAATHDFVHRRNQRVATFQRKALLPDVLVMQITFETFGGDQLRQHRSEERRVGKE